MVEYELTMLSDPRLFGLIAAHGMVDFAVPPSLLAIYALAAVPLGSIPTTASFCGLSLLHFGRDLGMLGERRGMVLSVVLHSLVGLVYLRDKDVAFSLMMLYSLIWHIPALYANLWTAKDYRALALALGASVAGVVAAGTDAVRSTVQRRHESRARGAAYLLCRFLYNSFLLAGRSRFSARANFIFRT